MQTKTDEGIKKTAKALIQINNFEKLSFENLENTKITKGKEIRSEEEIEFDIKKSESDDLRDLEIDKNRDDTDSGKTDEVEINVVINDADEDSLMNSTELQFAKNLETKSIEEVQKSHISGIKKNHSYELGHQTNTDNDFLDIDFENEILVKQRVRKLSQDILEQNRVNALNYNQKMLLQSKKNMAISETQNCKLLSGGDKKQKIIKMQNSFRSNNHKDFLVKINMIGDLRAGKSEFVGIVTDSKKPSTSKKKAKESLKKLERNLTKKE